MCDPLTMMIAGGAGLSALGSIQKGEGEAQQYELKSKVYGIQAEVAETGVNLLNNEADVAKMSADLAYSKSALQETRIRRAGELVQSAAKVDAVSRNLDPTVGSPLLLAARSAGQVQADIDIARAVGAMEAADAVSKYASLRQAAVTEQGKALTARVSQAASVSAAGASRIAGYIGAGTALLRGGTAAYQPGLFPGRS